LGDDVINGGGGYVIGGNVIDWAHYDNAPQPQ